MKLVIQIPCLNEEATLPATIRDLPREVPGFSSVEFLVIDDGSTDCTAEVARKLGVHHVLQLGSNRGLASAFHRGLAYSMEQGADVVVNTDADNQYRALDIPALVAPILANQADLVVGCRPILEHPEFSPTKKLLQALGSWILRQISRTNVRDAASGFRAFSRQTCQRIFLYGHFSHCMETLIQAGNSGLRVSSVEIGINPQTRPSRLFRNIPEYLFISSSTIIKMFILYRPWSFFASLSLPFFCLSLLLGLRFLYLVYWVDSVASGRSHIPSLILLSVSAFFGIFMITIGILAELTRAQRRLTEETLFLLKCSNKISKH